MKWNQNRLFDGSILPVATYAWKGNDVAAKHCTLYVEQQEVSNDQELGNKKYHGSQWWSGAEVEMGSTRPQPQNGGE